MGIWQLSMPAKVCEVDLERLAQHRAKGLGGDDFVPCLRWGALHFQTTSLAICAQGPPSHSTRLPVGHEQMHGIHA